MKKDMEKKGGTEIIESSKGREVDMIRPEKNASSFISFRYSYQEISSDGERTRVRSKKKSFENGKFKSEEFEGTLPGNVYSNMAGQMQKFFFNQVSALLSSFLLFLPSKSKDKKR